MDVSARRSETGEYLLEMGPVSFELSSQAVTTLQEVVNKRLNQSSDTELDGLTKKLAAYRGLATKMIAVDDRIMQKFATQVTPEQLVTMVRLADGDRLFYKVMRNLSRQNGSQFEQDFHDLNKITVHQACLYMEQVVPLIRRAAQEQKAAMAQLK